MTIVTKLGEETHNAHDPGQLTLPVGSDCIDLDGPTFLDSEEYPFVCRSLYRNYRQEFKLSLQLCDVLTKYFSLTFLYHVHSGCGKPTDLQYIWAFWPSFLFSLRLWPVISGAARKKGSALLKTFGKHEGILKITGPPMSPASEPSRM